MKCMAITRMLTRAAITSIAATGLISTAFAGSIQQPGLTTGLAEGYGMTEGLYSVTAINAGNRRTSPTSTTSTTAIPLFLSWSTPWEPLGGRFILKAAPVVHVGMRGPGMDMSSLYNPYYGAWVSWYLGNGFNLAIGEGVQARSNSNISKATGRDYNAFQQNIALSYVKDNWNITGNSFFTQGRTNNVMSQPRTANLDFTAIKRDGRAEMGFVGYGQWDLNKPATAYGEKQSEVAAGGLFGYLLGNQISAQVKLTTTLHQRNYGGRDTRVWFQLIIPIVTPAAPEPSNAPR